MILTNIQILDNCNYVVNQSKTYDNYCSILFEMMFNHGLRTEEVTEKTLWTYLGATSWQLQTAKGGGTRIFTELEMPQLFIAWLYSATISQALISKRRLRQIFDVYSKHKVLEKGNKQISCHLFRHNKAKVLHDSGMTDLLIQSYFTLNSIAVTQRYIYSTIVAQ